MVINFWTLGIALLYLCRPFTTNAWRPYEVKLANFSFSPVSNHFSVNVTIKNSVIDAWIDVGETIERLYVHPEVHLDLGNGKYEFEFMNRIVDVCRLFRDRKYEPLIQMAHRSLLPYCNCPSRCPISKIYYVKAPQSNHAGVQYPTANALKIAYVPAPQPQHSVTYATAPTNSKVGTAPQPHYQNYQLAYTHQPISYSAAAIAVPYSNNHQQQIVQIPNGYQLAAYSHQPVQISQPYSYVTSAPNEAGKAIVNGPNAAQANIAAYHQQPQTFTFPTYQHLAAPINIPTAAKFVAFPTYSPSPSQYKTINAPHASVQPSATAATHSAHDGATSFASFSQQVNQRHHTAPTAIAPVKVLAQPHQQYYVTAPPPSSQASYSSQKYAFQPITAAASSPQAYETPHNGVIHYGTHLYHPVLGKYGIGQVAPAPQKLIYSH